MTFSSGSVESVNRETEPQEVVALSGRRVGVDDITCGTVQRPENKTNVPRVPSTRVGGDPSSGHAAAEGSVRRPRPFRRHLGITTRLPTTFHAAVVSKDTNPDTGTGDGVDGGNCQHFVTSPTGAWNDLHGNGTLEALVEQGWTWNPPPAPNEAGPSEWRTMRPPRSSDQEGDICGRKRHIRSYSIDGVDELLGDSSSASQSSKRHRFAQWETKGGFNLVSPLAPTGIQTKALTDVSMARSMGVEPGDEVTSKASKKRNAATSPPLPAGKWIFKRIKGNDDEATIHHTEADKIDRRFSMMVMRWWRFEAGLNWMGGLGLKDGKIVNNANIVWQPLAEKILQIFTSALITPFPK
ncbi:hypothetical protein BVRB_5g117930 [Beta vulgaris subsp. vulgaris]|nr:hypothetical protein BVRB_5g117930 [Beta vulgaris subsp. vulgaris]